MERIAIFAALQWECRPVLRNMHRVSRHRLGAFVVWRAVVAETEVWLVKTGVGLEQAARAARTVSDAGTFALFVSTGCAGALSPDLQPGDLAITTTVAGPTQERFDTDTTQRERLRYAAERAALAATLAPVLCSPHVLTTAAAKRAAATQYGAVAVEMEATPIAACAAQTGTPFVAVRAVLDNADMELSYAGKFIEPQTGAVKPFALAGYLATHPSAITDMLAMQRMMHAAQTSLQRFFAAWFVTLNS